MTRNITLAVDENLLAKYRLLAAERKTTVNGLVRKHMEEAVGLEAQRRTAIARMLELSETTGAKIDMRRWNRADSYDRTR